MSRSHSKLAMRLAGAGLGALMLGSVVAADALLPSGPSMKWSTVDGGGGYSFAVTLDYFMELTGTIGQVDADASGPMTGGIYTFSTGYWNDHSAGPAVVCVGDLTNDGFINTDDLLLLVGSWGTNGVGDINQNGIVNTDDLVLLVGAWGTCPGY